MKTLARSLLSMMMTAGLVSVAAAQTPAAPAAPAAKAPAAAAPAAKAPAAAPVAQAAPAKTAPTAPAPAAAPAASKPAPVAPTAKPVAPTGAPVPVKADPVAPTPPPAMPAAPAEVAAIVKAAPSLRCTGSVFSPMGETKINATIKNKVDLDKFWVHTSFVQNGGMKFKFESYSTYDASTKKWHRVMMDNFGTYEVATSTGPKDGKQIWEGTSTSAMGAMLGRHTEDSTDAKVGVKMWGEFSMDKGKSWMKAYDMVCKR